MPSIFVPMCKIAIQTHLEYIIQAFRPIPLSGGNGKNEGARSEVRKTASACPA